MQTYFDAIIARLRKDVAHGLVGVPSQFEEYLRQASSLSAVGAAPEHGTPTPQSDLALRFFRYTRPLVAPAEFQKQPLALMLAAESVPVFREGDINASVRTVASEDIAAAGVAYVDIPHGAFPVGDDLHIRMIVAVPDAFGLRLVAAIAPLRSNRGRLFSWLLGDNTIQGAADVAGWVGRRPNGVSMGISLGHFTLSIEDGLAGSVRRTRKLLREIEKVALLAVAQLRSIADAGEEAQLACLPHVGLMDPQRHRGNVKKVERENAIFRIRRLPHLRGVRVVDDGDDVAGCNTTSADWDGPRRQVAVRSFFRMQPYGPGRELRRLIQVAAHTRWVRDDGRVEMIQLNIGDGEGVRPDAEDAFDEALAPLCPGRFMETATPEVRA
jgi:hypothetical protein